MQEQVQKPEEGSGSISSTAHGNNDSCDNTTSQSQEDPWSMPRPGPDSEKGKLSVPKEDEEVRTGDRAPLILPLSCGPSTCVKMEETLAKNDCDIAQKNSDHDNNEDDTDKELKMNGDYLGKQTEFIVNKDDPLCEDIISCISALDEMLAEFDDTSLPYTAELETSCGDSLLPTSDQIAVTDSVVSVTGTAATALHSQSRRQLPHTPTKNDGSGAAVNDNSRIVPPESVVTSSSNLYNGNNKLIDQNQNLDWSSPTEPKSGSGEQHNSHQQNLNNNGPLIHTSHLIQIPVVEAGSSPSSSNSQLRANQNQGNKNGTKSATISSQVGFSTSTEMNGNGSCGGGSAPNRGTHSKSKKLGNGSGSGGAASASSSSQPRIATGGGTYSKGTSYEILIPKISPESFTRDSTSSISCGKGTITTSSHSSRASIMVPVIESNVEQNSPGKGESGNVAVGKMRSQLNMGLFQQQHVPGQKGTAHTSHVPVLAEGAASATDIVIGRGSDSSALYENQVGSNERSNPHRELDRDKDTTKEQQHPQHSNPPSDKGKSSKLASIGGGVSSTYISASEGKSSLGHTNGSGASSAIAMMTVGDEEQWNFPSEKNLPRSLRKTRKTCFLDEGEQGDGKIAKPPRAESPYCCSSTDSNGGMSRMEDMDGRGATCHKSPRVMPRKGISSKCEIINKEDGHFALVDSANKRSWTGQQKQQNITNVGTSSPSPSPSSTKDVMIGRGNRRKIYEDVVLSKTTMSTSPLLAKKRLEHCRNTNGEFLQHHQHSTSLANSNSPSSSFSSTSGVSSGVMTNPSFMEEHSSNMIPSKRREDQPHQQLVTPKPRARQQIPSPGLQIPTPANQFVPLAIIDRGHEEFLYRSQVSCDPIVMSSHHSPNVVEIGAERDLCGRGGRQSRGDENDSSSTDSPVKLCHTSGLRQSSADTEFEETASDSKILKIEEKSRRQGQGKSHSKKGSLEAGGGQNGSLPNQSQMMRMVMMMKSSGSGRNTSVSSSRSSSSSGSVSVKSSSSSSENNCGDVFHENIVQDYPANIFNVATAVIELDGKKSSLDGDIDIPPSDKVEREVEESQNTTVVYSGDVVVLRTKGEGGSGSRGNVQPGCSKPGKLAAGKRGNNGNAGVANQPNTTLDIDDGYLSMINRNEAPLLWPEEFIENETFSKDELKRLSVHLNEDDGEGDSDGEEDYEGSSNSNSAQQKVKKYEKLVGMNMNKSGFPQSGSGHNNRSSISSSSNTSSSNNGNVNGQPRKGRREGRHGASSSGGGAGRSSTEKTDYFSDDSLEMDGDDELLLQSGGSETNNKSLPGKTDEVVVRASTSFIIPFHTKDERQEESSACQPRKDEKGASHQHRKGSSQISKIPKMLSPLPSNNRRSSSGSIQKYKQDNAMGKAEHHQKSSNSERSSPTNSVRKSCSFFIPFASPDSHNGAAGSKGDRKLSSGDNPPIVTSVVVTERSTSQSNGKSQNANASTDPIKWDISPGTSGVELNTRRQQRKETKAKASSDIYNSSDLSNRKREGEVEEDSSKQSESSASINNNNANCTQTKDGVEGEQNVQVTRTGKVLSVETETDNDPSRAPTNRSEGTQISSSTSIPIPAPSNTNTTTSPANSTSAKHAGSPGTGGGSMRKRHKFEKQQTFIVSPSRDTTTSGGQRLIDQGDDDNKTDYSSQQQSTKLIITDDHGHGVGRMKKSKNGDDLVTPDNVLTTNDTTTPSSQPTNDSVFQSHSIQGAEDITELSEVLKALDKLSGESIPNMISEDVESAAKRLPPAGGTPVKTDTDDGTTSTFSRKTDQKVEKRVVDQGNIACTQNHTQNHNQPMGQGEERERVGQEEKVSGSEGVSTEDSYTSQDHEVATDELESVVKMFLKATEGLLHPENEIDSNSCEKDQTAASQSSYSPQSQSQPASNDNDELTKEAKSDVTPSEVTCDEPNSTCGENAPELENTSSLSDMTGKMPLMTSTPIMDRSNQDAPTKTNELTCQKRISFHMLSEPDEDETEPIIEDLELQPPTFIPEPPPLKKDVDLVKPLPGHPHQPNLDGKAALDILSQRITRNCPSRVENMSVSQFLHNKKNIWAMYDRPYDEDVLPQSFPRGYASRSQENLVDAMTHERLTKSFSARGQSSTLPLNCRPPPVQRRTSTFRNMFNKFRKHKATDTVIPEGSEMRDEEAQSITSRETGPSEGKKRGFFSRLFRRSRKH